MAEQLPTSPLPKAITEEFLTCKICLDAFKKPKILSCLHTFCLKCLDDHVTKNCLGITLSCPLCRQPTPLSGGVTALRDNFYVTGLQDAISFQLPCETINTIFCDSCRERGEEKFAHKRCLQCQEYMCDTCLDAHQRLNLTRYHMTVTCEDLSPRNKHKKNEMTFIHCRYHESEKGEEFCSTCQAPVCLICLNAAHSHHLTTNLKEAMNDQKQHLKKIVADLQDKAIDYDMILNDWKEYDKELQEMSEGTFLKLEKRKVELLKLIETWYEDTRKQKVQQTVELEKSLILEKLNTLEFVLEKFNTTMEIINTALIYADEQQILELSCNIQSELAKIEQLNCGMFKLALQNKLQLELRGSDKPLSVEHLGCVDISYKNLTCQAIKPTQEIKLESFFETRGEDIAGRFDASGLSATRNGTLLVADRQMNRVAVFDSKGTQIREFTIFQSGKPISSIQLTNQDLVVVREKVGVCIIDRTGKDKRLIKDHFSKPCSVTSAGNGAIFMVLDYDFKTLSVFCSTTYTRISKIKLHYKNRSVWDKVAVNSKGHLFLLVHKENCIIELTPDGKKLNQYGHWGSDEAGALYWPKGLAIDQYDNVIVVDSTNNRLQLLSPQKTWVILDCPDDHKLHNPTDVTIMDNGHLCVLESSGTVKIFSYIP